MGRRAFTDASRRALDPERALAALALLFALAQLTEAALSHDPGVRAVTLVFARPDPGAADLRVARAAGEPARRRPALRARRGPRRPPARRLRRSRSSCAWSASSWSGCARPRAIWSSAAVAAVGLLTATSVLEGASGDMACGIAWVAIVPVGIPALAGRVLRSRNALNRRLDEQAREIESNRAEREAAAVLGERTRIARELHDVVAHDVSVMLVQAAAAKRTVPGRPRARPRRHRRGRGHRARGARGAAAAARRPAARRRGARAGAAALAGADRGARAAHARDRAARRARGGRRPRPPAARRRRRRLSHRPGGARQRRAPRGRHARGRARRLRAGRPSSSWSATTARGDDGPIRDGRGLVSLRERVALYGGELRAGRRRPRGFELRARLPVGEPAA